MLLLVVLGGTLSLMAIEDWGVSRALYFTLITITTVGYGDEGISEQGRNLCILLMVGRNVKKKCFHLAVEALAELRTRGLDVCLVYVGKAGGGKDLDAVAEELGVADRFHPLGEMSYFELPEIYASADIFVFPSRLETFGNVTIEAMASGLPCVEFDYLANREKIVDGETGHIVPWGDVPALANAIAKLVEDPQRRKRMSVAAHRVARETFDWTVVVERYRSVLRDTARAGDRPGSGSLNESES